MTGSGACALHALFTSFVKLYMCQASLQTTLPAGASKLQHCCMLLLMGGNRSADDSSSMKYVDKGERIDDLNAIVEKVTEVATLFDDDGITVSPGLETEGGNCLGYVLNKCNTCNVWWFALEKQQLYSPLFTA